MLDIVHLVTLQYDLMVSSLYFDFQIFVSPRIQKTYFIMIDQITTIQCQQSRD